MNVLQFTLPGPRMPHPLFGFLSSLAGLRPGDYLEQINPDLARLNIDVSDVGDRGIRVEHRDGALTVKALRWGGEEVLRRIRLQPSLVLTRHRRRGDVLEIDLSVVRDAGPPPTTPAVAFAPRPATSPPVPAFAA